jgi:hypothetical protein
MAIGPSLFLLPLLLLSLPVTVTPPLPSPSPLREHTKNATLAFCLSILLFLTPKRGAPQAVAGDYAAWDPPRSYSSVAFMNADLGIYRRTEGRCARDGELISIRPLGMCCVGIQA